MEWKHPWWSHMLGVMDECKKRGVTYPPTEEQFRIWKKEFEDTVNKTFEAMKQMEFPFIVKNKQVYKMDNGYLLDFNYSSGSKVLKTKRVYLTEGELENGIAALEIEFDNLLKE